MHIYLLYFIETKNHKKKYITLNSGSYFGFCNNSAIMAGSKGANTYNRQNWEESVGFNLKIYLF